MASTDIFRLDHIPNDFEGEIIEEEFIGTVQSLEAAESELLMIHDHELRRLRFDLLDSYFTPCGDFAYPFYINVGLWWWMVGHEELLGFSVPCHTQPARWFC